MEKSKTIFFKKIVFVGSMYPEEIKDDLKSHSIGLLGNANDLFQKNLIKGLDIYADGLEIVNFPNIGSYPKKYKKIFVPSFFQENIKSYSFINIPFVKYLTQLSSLIKYFFVNRKTEVDLVVLYDLYLVFLLALPFIKLFNNKVKICFVVPDLPSYTGDGVKVKISSMITNVVFKFSKKYIDFYSLITSSMANVLSIDKSKSVVVEGLYDSSLEGLNDIDGIDFVKSAQVIVYSGSLDERNGVRDLIEAFKIIKNSDSQLHIYGDGELRSEIEELSKCCSKVLYFGQVDNKEVVKSYKSASVLVNPRKPIHEFTRYSFPSKTMEYLASGTPVVMYRLPGVPVSYYDYVYVPNDLTVKGLAQAIDYILTSKRYEIMLTCNSSRDFILQEKSYDAQAYKLLSFIFSAEDKVI